VWYKNKILKNVDELHPHDEVKVQLYKGEFISEVKKIKP
jgi:exonuclease VII large subunit